MSKPNTKTIIDLVEEGNPVRVKEVLEATLYERAGVVLQEKRKQVIAEMCSAEPKQVDEATAKRVRMYERRTAFMKGRKLNEDQYTTSGIDPLKLYNVTVDGGKTSFSGSELMKLVQTGQIKQLSLDRYETVAKVGGITASSQSEK